MSSSLACLLVEDRLRAFSAPFFVDRFRLRPSEGAASEVPSVRYVPLAFLGKVAVVVRAHSGTTNGLRSVLCPSVCARRGGDVAGPPDDPDARDALFSPPGSEATCDCEESVFVP